MTNSIKLNLSLIHNLLLYNDIEIHILSSYNWSLIDSQLFVTSLKITPHFYTKYCKGERFLYLFVQSLKLKETDKKQHSSKNGTVFMRIFLETRKKCTYGKTAVLQWTKYFSLSLLSRCSTSVTQIQEDTAGRQRLLDHCNILPSWASWSKESSNSVPLIFDMP